MAESNTHSRRDLPSVDQLLRFGAAADLIAKFGRNCVVGAVRDVLQVRRETFDSASTAGLSAQHLLEETEKRLSEDALPSLRRVFNMSGTVLHTNLGRAVLADRACQAALSAMSGATNLEFDLETGARGERDDHVEALLCRLTGAPAATVVNNNAAAVLLALSTVTVATRKDVIVSRGELVEIGGAFRIPDVMSRAGCRLREVGTTNRTHLHDYEGAIGVRTAALMKVHASNYSIQGFTTACSQSDLADLAHRQGLPLLVDLGSGTLLDLRKFGLPHEPTPMAAIADGVDAVTFSGDKLLGGPQCGIIVGNKELVARMRSNPLKRALRLDKIFLAALEATLRLYLDPQRAQAELPTLRWLTRSRADIQAKAQRLLPILAAATAGHADAVIVDCLSQIGSGSLPVDLLPSAGIALNPIPGDQALSSARFAQAFRCLPIPVIGRIQKGAFILDLRCLDDETAFAQQLQRLKLGAESS